MQIGMELAGYWPHHRHHIDNMFPEMMETVKLADQIGLDSFLMGEHHFMDFNSTPAPIALATHVAALTKRQRLILAVLILPLHDVQRLAGELAMADQLTRGRIEVGFGRGGGAYELERFHAPSDYETSRAIFEERLEAMRILFQQQDVTLDWPHTKFKDVSIVPPVFQKPYPPIWLAAMRPESAYHIAKQGYHVQTGQLRNPMSFVHEVVQAFRRGVAEAESKPHKSKISVLQWVYVAKDENDRKHKIELAYQKQRKFMGLLKNESVVKGGRVEGIEVGGSPESYAETLVIGSKEYVQDRMLEFKELGFDDFIMKLHCGPDHDDIMGSMDRFGEHVLPVLRQGDEALAPAS